MTRKGVGEMLEYVLGLVVLTLVGAVAFFDVQG